MNPVTVLTAAFNPAAAYTRRATVLHAWYRCWSCGEDQLRRRGSTGRCSMTPGCDGRMVPVLVARCETCGAELTGRSRDGRYCRRECRKGGDVSGDS